MKIREFLKNQKLFCLFVFFLSFFLFPAWPLPTSEKTKAPLAETEASPSKQALLNLEKMAQTSSPSELHNIALKLLKDRKKNQATLLLKRNSYKNLFPLSVLALWQLNVPVFFPVFLWHFGFLLITCFCCFSLFLSIKKLSTARLKTMAFGLSLLALSLFIHSVFLKKRAESLQLEELKSAPFLSAPTRSQIQPGEVLVILGQNKNWLRVEGRSKTKGWIQKQKVFQIF